MTKNVIVERALHLWDPWVKSVEHGRRILYPDATADDCWNYAGEVLRTLKLPTKAVLRIYFLSCIFSSYNYGEDYIFSEIRLPPPEKRKAGIPGWSNFYPLPPAILTKKEIQSALQWFGYNSPSSNMSPSKAISRFFGDFIVLDDQHALRQKASKMKRYRNPDIAIACALMSKEGQTLAEISKKFGWKPQKGGLLSSQKGSARMKRNRFPTASRHVRWGNKLIANSHEKNRYC